MHLSMAWADGISGVCGPKYGVRSDCSARMNPSIERRNGGDARSQQHLNLLRPSMTYAVGSNDCKHTNTKTG
jgi:hypothetical protein